MAPALTVYSQKQSLDPQLAPPEALLALPGMTPERVAELLSGRRNGQTRPADADALAPSLKGRAFSIRIDIERSTGKHSYRAVIRFTDNPGSVYWLLDWQDRTKTS